MMRMTRRRVVAAAATLVLSAVGLTACGSKSEPTPSAAPSSGAASAYPMTLESPFGKTELKEKPKRVAVVSDIDLDIALALGIKPVISPRYGDAKLEPWEAPVVEKLGGDLTTYNSTDGVDFEAIAAAKPDVILATSGWSLDKDYAQLSKIAPVVSYQGKDGLSAMTWDQRTKEAAKALDETPKAEAVIAEVTKKFDTAKAAHPEFAGKSFTYAVIHPQQITYESYKGGDVSFFTRLGFTQPEMASKFGAKNNGVSRENLDVLDSDILLIGYPFGDEGLMSREKLEADPLFKQLKVVSGGHYAVVPDEIASPLAYPTPLSEPWLVDQLVPILSTAAAGKK
ncbi:ABC transporter substrate-binding protein [Devriesea agamarum]|uniref:ABC transporter substrate-binding protein n=1 Tax=Devriesea agamarum TaxID=472569 RepID=UPI000A0764BB|nr:ABC transporter substrate-binding protein [Devriesea agamarum]